MIVRIPDYCVEIKNTLVVVALIFLKHNGMCGQAISSSRLRQVDSTVDNFHNSWPSQEVIHDKIILKACFDSSVKNVLVYEYIRRYNSEIMLNLA